MTAKRVVLGVATLAATVIGLVAGPSSASWGFSPSDVKPTLTATEAAFAVPSSPAGTYILKLWTLPAPSQLVGLTQGTSGTLTLPVPQTANCEFQVDVRYEAPNSQTSSFYSGLIATVPGCGQSGTGQRLTPGYWKNHQAATEALLPVSLGNYVVTTFSQASAVFTAMKCNDAIDCLAGHLLSTKLDLASGSSMCITGVVFQADALLKQTSYAGPASYSITSTQRSTALTLEQELDHYANDSSATSC